VTTHADARAFATRALTQRFGGAPSAGEVKALAGIGSLETSYGDGWKGDGAGSHNIGAIHADSSWTGDVFTATDTKPNDDGTSTTYTTRFRAYPTAFDGWLDFVNVAFVQHGRSSVRIAASNNDWPGVSRALYETGYYGGFGKTPAERIQHHVTALERAISSADGKAKVEVAPSIQIRVQNPQGDLIGMASVSDAVAPGLSALAGVYGAPIMVAYPNGWRFLKFAPDVQIPVKSGHPYTPIDQQEPLSFGWKSGAIIGILGIVVTIFVGTLQVNSGKRVAA
jgi:hypothetical protein